MEKIYVLCLAAVAFLFMVQPAAAYTEQQQVTLAVDSKLASVNGEVRFLKYPPFIVEGTTLVPLRFISTAFTAGVSWDPGSKTAHIVRDNMRIKISPGQFYATVNDHRVPLNISARVKEGTTFVPLRFISDILGARIGWNSQNRTINISMHVYRHDRAGFSFVCPGKLTLHSEGETFARFTGSGDRALVVEKLNSPQVNMQLIREKYPRAKVLLESNHELWVTDGNLTMLYKLVPQDDSCLSIIYGMAADRFSRLGRNEYELIINTLKIKG